MSECGEQPPAASAARGGVDGCGSVELGLAVASSPGNLQLCTLVRQRQKSWLKSVMPAHDDIFGEPALL